MSQVHDAIALAALSVQKDEIILIHFTCWVLLINKDFSDIPKPNSVEIEYQGGGYLYLQFDNGWRLSGRLHTATEWLKPSIKFDIQPVNLDSVVPPIYISTFSETLV